LIELVLARALYRCGDYEGIGKKILSEYAHDLRGHYSRHAYAVLKERKYTQERSKPKYAGYLFAHVMKHDYGRLYYSISRDGLHWKLLNDGKRILDDEYYGHPDICRGHDGRFYLLGGGNPEISIWGSENLVSWSKLRDYDPDVPNACGLKPNKKHHGAPKCFYDIATGQYLISWHNPFSKPSPSEPEKVWRSMRTFYTISKDMVHFSKPKRLFDFDFATIDVIIRRERNKYYAFLKDERWADFSCLTGKSIRMSGSENLVGPYSKPLSSITPNWREAPTLIPKLDGTGWYLYYEEYPGISYGCSTAKTLTGPWYNLYWKEYEIPEGVRHGGMIGITEEEYHVLIDAYGK